MKANHKLDQIEILNKERRIRNINQKHISVQKTKSMAFKGRDPVRTKTLIDNKIIEQVNVTI